MKSKKLWNRPQIIPMPMMTYGLEKNHILLSSKDWKYNQKFTLDLDSKGWEDIEVPKQLSKFGGTSDIKYAFYKRIKIPESWDGKKFVIRFDGVNCLATVYINGKLIKSHYGGFVAWDCDITQYVMAGTCCDLVIGVEDKTEETSVFNGGGILRDVHLYAIPKEHVTRLHVKTEFDEEYFDSKLTIIYELNDSLEVELELKSPDGEIINLGKHSLVNEGELEFEIKNPKKWNSENPNLYKLTVNVMKSEKTIETIIKKIGFRQVKIVGTELYVNGDLTKLRGINRHDTHPLLGKAINRELVLEDVKLFKEANINFIRTSHYPARSDFLDLCDEYGIYVEDEASIAFIGQTIRYTQNDIEFSDKFLGQFADMMERDLSHPSVIIWSLANECYWGSNFDLINRYAHLEDPTRPTIFSYPITMKEEDEMVDIWSLHYGLYGVDTSKHTDCFDNSTYLRKDFPVLHDESTHIPCYAIKDLRRDPAIRDFWGHTIKGFWDSIWETKGAIGCAIWAGIDEEWLIEERDDVGREWGIIDGWRRRKPEFWHVKKAFSPIKVFLDSVRINENKELVIEVENRFNHTNLDMIRLDWSTNIVSGFEYGPSLIPRHKGEWIIKGDFSDETKVELSFTDSKGNVLNIESVLLKEEIVLVKDENHKRPQIFENDNSYIIKGDEISFEFSKETGMILSGKTKGNELIIGGPNLVLTGLDLEKWRLESINTIYEKSRAKVIIRGNYGEVTVEYKVLIDSAGCMTTTYEIVKMPYASPRRVSMRMGYDVDEGGYEEVGISYTLISTVDKLSWIRKGIWSKYPDWHIGRLEGESLKYFDKSMSLFKKPDFDWKNSDKDYFLFGKWDIGHRGCEDFRSTKFSIKEACAYDLNSGALISTYSNYESNVRLELKPNSNCIVEDTDERIKYIGDWSRQTNRNKSYGGTETWSKKKGSQAIFSFIGTGISWISSCDLICGVADIYIDDVKIKSEIDLGVKLGPGIPRGYEKDYRKNVFSVGNLQYGKHTIRIEVIGEKAAESMNSYVIIDRFVVIDPKCLEEILFIVSNEINYPELAWGCYVKPPIIVESGYCNTVKTKLSTEII